MILGTFGSERPYLFTVKALIVKGISANSDTSRVSFPVSGRNSIPECECEDREYQKLGYFTMEPILLNYIEKNREKTRDRGWRENLT